MDTTVVMKTTEASQNFSRVLKEVDESGAAFLRKGEAIKYLIMQIDMLADKEDIGDMIGRSVDNGRLRLTGKDNIVKISKAKDGEYSVEFYKRGDISFVAGASVTNVLVTGKPVRTYSFTEHVYDAYALYLEGELADAPGDDVLWDMIEEKEKDEIEYEYNRMTKIKREFDLVSELDPLDLVAVQESGESISEAVEERRAEQEQLDLEVWEKQTLFNFVDLS